MANSKGPGEEWVVNYMRSRLDELRFDSILKRTRWYRKYHYRLDLDELPDSPKRDGAAGDAEHDFFAYSRFVTPRRIL